MAENDTKVMTLDELRKTQVNEEPIIQQQLRQTNEELKLFVSKTERIHGKLEYINRLQVMSLSEAIAQYLTNLSIETRKNYTYYFKDMQRRNIIPMFNKEGLEFTVDDFNFFPHEAMIDYIKKVQDWSEGTRQVKAACYISLTSWLNRISEGWFRRAQPSILSSNKTFFKVREKCATKALSRIEWQKFKEALAQIDYRDSLIARTMLQGAKRISEALTVKLEQVCFEKNIINFHQKKTGGVLKVIPITYPKDFMNELQDYIKATTNFRKSDYLFITKNGRPVTRARLNQTFEKAGNMAKVGHVSPHVLRATFITIVKQDGLDDGEIMRISGHSSLVQVQAYDKNSAEDNYTKKINLV